MAKQFLAAFGAVLGLALIAFLGYALPYWTLLAPELKSDAILLRIVLFVNDYAALILAASCFFTGLFLPFRSGVSSPPHLICTFLAVCLLSFAAAQFISAWHHRLPGADQRLALLEQQSLKHRSSGARALQTKEALLIPAGPSAAPDEFPPNAKASEESADETHESGHLAQEPGTRREEAPSAFLPMLAAKIDGELYLGGRLSLTDWRLEQSARVGSNIEALPLFQLPEGIEALKPERPPYFFTAKIDQSAARFLRWPVSRAAGKFSMVNTPSFLLGLALLSCGVGLLLNKRGASLIQTLEAFSVFLITVILPMAVFHLWWQTIGEEEAAQGIGYVRAAAALVFGALCFLLGHRRHRIMESRHGS